MGDCGTDRKMKVNFTINKKKSKHGSNANQAKPFFNDDVPPSTGADAAAVEIEKREREGCGPLIIPLINSQKDKDRPLLDRRRGGEVKVSDRALNDSDFPSQPLQYDAQDCDNDCENDSHTKHAMEALIKSAAGNESNVSDTNFTGKGALVIPTNTGTKLKHHSESGLPLSDTLDMDDDQRFRREIDQQAEDVSIHSSAYVNVPIAEFGAAMLRGMGWKGHENTKKGEEESHEVKQRPQRLGIGATAIPTSVKHVKASDIQRVQKDGKSFNITMKKIHEQQEKERQASLKRIERDLQRTVQVGSIVHLLDRNEHDLRAKVVKTTGVSGLNKILVCLEGSRKEKIVTKSDVALVKQDELEGKPFAGPSSDDADLDSKETSFNHSNKDSKERGNNGKERGQSLKDDFRDSERESRKRKKNDVKISGGKRQEKKSRRKHESNSVEHWLIPNIRVRVVTRRVANGRQYLQKGIVLDVLERGAKASIQMANGELLDAVPEMYLETALPKLGGTAIILSGPMQYSKGTLIERNSKRCKGVVQLLENMDVITVSLDDVSEWCGQSEDY